MHLFHVNVHGTLRPSGGVVARHLRHHTRTTEFCRSLGERSEITIIVRLSHVLLVREICHVEKGVIWTYLLVRVRRIVESLGHIKMSSSP